MHPPTETLARAQHNLSVLKQLLCPPQVYPRVRPVSAANTALSIVSNALKSPATVCHAATATAIPPKVFRFFHPLRADDERLSKFSLPFSAAKLLRSKPFQFVSRHLFRHTLWVRIHSSSAIETTASHQEALWVSVCQTVHKPCQHSTPCDVSPTLLHGVGQPTPACR